MDHSPALTSARIKLGEPSSPCTLLNPAQGRITSRTIVGSPARDLEGYATASGSDWVYAMSGLVDAGDPPCPGVLGLPAGDLEGEPEADRGLDPTAHAEADLKRRGLHGSHARTPAWPFTRVDQDAPGDTGGGFDDAADLVNRISPRWGSRTP